MKPYYKDDYATIFHADCREVLPTLDKVDLVLTDPPYGIAYKHGGGNYANAPTVIDAVAGDDTPFDPAFLPRPMIVWGANHYHARIPDGGRWLVWDKREGVIPERDQADCELAWCSDKGVDRMFRHYWDGFNRKSERGIPRVHPTQKPEALMKWCMGFYPEAQTILDPFMGSGTTLRAAKDLRRKCIGIELEEKYCEIAAIRLQQEVLAL